MKKLLAKLNQNSTIYNYLITYLIVFLIPILICSVFFITLISSVSKDVMLNKQRELQQTAVLSDAIMEEISYFGDSIVSNNKVNSFKHEKDIFGYPNTYKVIEFKNELPDVIETNQSIFDYYIFFNNSELMVNNKSVYTYEDFFDLCLSETESNSYEDGISHLQEVQYGKRITPMKSYKYKDDLDVNLLIYKQPLSTSSPNVNYGEVWIAIQDTVFEAVMPPMAEGIAQYIIDSDGNVLYSKVDISVLSQLEEEKITSSLLKTDNKDKQELFKINGERYKSIEYMSEESGLSYVVIQPEKVIDQKKSSSIATMIICISLAMLAGMVLSYYMSKQSATPINDLLKESDRAGELSREPHKFFTHLKYVSKELIKNNSRMKEAIDNQKPYIKNNFMNRLIYGGIISGEELTKTASLIDLEIENHLYGVVIFGLVMDDNILKGNDNVTEDHYMISLQEVVENVMPGSIYTNNGNNQLVVLMDVPNCTHEEYLRITEEKVESIINRLPASISNKIYVLASNEETDLSNIYETYQNTLYMFKDKGKWLDKGIVWYSKCDEGVCEYPSVDFSMKLTHYTMSGDEERLYDELERILKTYILSDDFPIYLQNLLLNELQSGIFRLLGRIEIEEEEYRKYYDKLAKNQNASLLEQITNTINLYREICSYMAEKKEDINCKILINSIVAYIDENYYDENLSLINVADMFDVSEQYLSSVFKECMDINFSTYVENVRIDKAKELLVTTTMAINEIASKVGYYSANSFSRAFKRVVENTPSKYRVESEYKGT